MWSEFERCFDDLERSVTEAEIVDNVIVMARRDARRCDDLQLLQWVVEGHGVDRLSLSDDHSTALAKRVMSRVMATIRL